MVLMETLQSKVLIVEDNLPDVTLLSVAFKEYGNGDFELMHAASFDFALKLIFKEKIDAILLDLSLPLFLGLEPLTRIHQARPHIPLFVFSGYNDPDLASQALQIGAKAYIVKNHLDGAALVKMVREAINHRRLFASKKEIRQNTPAPRSPQA